MCLQCPNTQYCEPSRKQVFQEVSDPMRTSKSKSIAGDGTMCPLIGLKIEEAIACTSLAWSDCMVYVARSRGILSDFRQTLDLDIKNTIFSSHICRSLQELLYSILCKYSFEFFDFKSTTQHPLPLIPLTPPGAI
jgi:hypothetical protein